MTASDSDHSKMNRFQLLLKPPVRSAGVSAKDIIQAPVVDTVGTGKDSQSDVHTKLHGPLREKSDFAQKCKALDDFMAHARRGQPHAYWMKLQREAAANDPALAHDPLSINIVHPGILGSDSAPPKFANRVILANPKEAERIAVQHVKKQPNFTPFLFQSLIATTDNDHWARQRKFLTQSFLPKGSLAKIFPTSLARAKHCATVLGGLAQNSGPYGVQMHEFYLHEAQAQLQMALFGMDEEFMEKTNKAIRDVFSGNSKDSNFGKDMCLQMMEKVKSDPRFATANEEAVLNHQKPVFGPLSKAIANASTELDMNLVDRFGNMMLVLFAGHDTTAHTMTWLTYEMARNPKYQRRLQAEVDAMFAELNGRDMTYEDCEKLPFLTKCVMETLRLWPAVPNGTFRELQHEEVVTGPGGKPVKLPKGTNVQIVTWMRHRNPALWGKDAAEFNPDREFQGNEAWGKYKKAFHASNPASPRFSPFTFQPRDCLGKNFAQMEMRTILSNVFRRYSFELSEPYTDENVAKNGPIENFAGTMGPRDLTPEGLAEQARREAAKEAPMQTMAMYLKAIPRNAAAKL